jgi:hypothetical protein
LRSSGWSNERYRRSALPHRDTARERMKTNDRINA